MNERGRDDADERADQSYRLTHDMEAVKDFHAFSDRLHRVMADHDPERIGCGCSSRRMRIVLEVPPEWLMLALWMRQRSRDRDNGLDRAIGGSIGEEFTAGATALAKAGLWQSLYEAYHDDLHWLATGAHPLLTPKPLDFARPHRMDPEADIPF